MLIICGSSECWLHGCCCCCCVLCIVYCAVPGKDVMPPQCIGQCIVVYCIAIVLRRGKVLPILIAFLKSIVLQLYWKNTIIYNIITIINNAPYSPNKAHAEISFPPPHVYQALVKYYCNIIYCNIINYYYYYCKLSQYIIIIIISAKCGNIYCNIIAVIIIIY
jgi:galactitol-specific phosphotransferase system IIC component